MRAPRSWVGDPAFPSPGQRRGRARLRRAGKHLGSWFLWPDPEPARPPEGCYVDSARRTQADGARGGALTCSNSAVMVLGSSCLWNHIMYLVWNRQDCFFRALAARYCAFVPWGAEAEGSGLGAGAGWQAEPRPRHRPSWAGAQNTPARLRRERRQEVGSVFRNALRRGETNRDESQKQAVERLSQGGLRAEITADLLGSQRGDGSLLVPREA